MRPLTEIPEHKRAAIEVLLRERNALPGTDAWYLQSVYGAPTPNPVGEGHPMAMELLRVDLEKKAAATRIREVAVYLEHPYDDGLKAARSKVREAPIPTRKPTLPKRDTHNKPRVWDKTEKAPEGPARPDCPLPPVMHEVRKRTVILDDDPEVRMTTVNVCRYHRHLWVRLQYNVIGQQYIIVKELDDIRSCVGRPSAYFENRASTCIRNAMIRMTVSYEG